MTTLRTGAISIGAFTVLLGGMAMLLDDVANDSTLAQTSSVVLVWAPLALLLGTLLLPDADNWRQRCAAGAVFASFAALATLLWLHVALAVGIDQLTPLAMVLVPWLLATSSAHLLLRQLVGVASAQVCMLAGLLALMTLPLWLGVWSDALPAWLTDTALVAASPLSAFASALEHDYLRGNWFYAQTPLGGGRFDYLPAGVYTLATTFVAMALTLVSAGIEVRQVHRQAYVQLAPLP